MKLKEIRSKYAIAREQQDRWNLIVSILKELYETKKKMMGLFNHPKFGRMVRLDCPEKYCGGDVSLAFCVERCTIKCVDYKSIKRKYPQLLELVKRINAKYFRLLQKFEEIKGVDL